MSGHPDIECRFGVFLGGTNDKTLFVGEALCLRAENLDINGQKYHVKETYKREVFSKPKTGITRFVRFTSLLGSGIETSHCEVENKSAKTKETLKCKLVVLRPCSTRPPLQPT